MSSSLSSSSSSSPPGQLLLLDHLNINHKSCDHSSIISFYRDTLGMVLDDRKPNPGLPPGRGTLWANGGATQFHLSEGKPDPQVLDGVVHLAYSSPAALKSLSTRAALANVSVHSLAGPGTLTLNCPYGNTVTASVGEGDSRGGQPHTGPGTECKGITGLTLFVRDAEDLPGISRFYNAVFSLETRVAEGGKSLTIPFGPSQSVRFEEGPLLNQEYKDGEGPHVSMYVSDLEKVWTDAVEAFGEGVTYANPR